MGELIWKRMFGMCHWLKSKRGLVIIYFNKSNCKSGGHVPVARRFECHSPIFAAVNGTPFFYLRQPEDTIKGQMYYDLDFDDWIFEIEQTEGSQITARLREIWTDYLGAQAYLRKGMDQVSDIYKERVGSVNKLI